MTENELANDVIHQLSSRISNLSVENAILGARYRDALSTIETLQAQLRGPGDGPADGEPRGEA